VTEGDGLSVESESSGLLFATEFTREISGATRITAKYGNSYSDSGERFRDLNEAGNGVDMNAEDVNVSDEPFRLQEFMLSVDRSTNIDSLRIQLGFDDEDYTKSSDDDRQRKDLYMSYMRRITTALRLGLNANYSQQKYSQPQREDKDWSVSLVGTFDLTENIGLQLSLGPRKRTSSGAEPGSDFKESRALLEIVYATGSYRG
jgi:outer membrane usher protein FimD/PapC